MKTEQLKVKEHLPNTKEWANTATSILRNLIEKHNELVEKIVNLEEKIKKYEQL